MIWQIGDGASVCIWGDYWIQGEQKEGLKTPCPRGLENMRVKELINYGNVEWNREIIKTLFTNHDFSLITNLPLSCRLPQDKLLWAHTKTGQYTVKSGYWLGKQRHSTANHAC